jgi:hypothetical protein
MKRENLTQEQLKAALHYDPSTGVFTRLVDSGGRGGRKGSAAGYINDQGYVLIAVHSVQYRAHRLAWLYMTGAWPAGEVDHKNGVRADNWWANLRDVPTKVNAQNKRRAQKNSKTGLLGVSWDKKKGNYTARIKVDGRYPTLGSFDTPEAGHAAYVEAKRRLHEGCTI